MAQDAQLFVATHVMPTSMIALEPSCSAASLAMASPPMASESPCANAGSVLVPQDFLDVLCPRPHLADASRRLLRACASSCSSWFMVARSCIRREKARQQAFREYNGLPKTHGMPYEPQPMTAAEAAIASLAEDTLRALFGDAPAEYARSKFHSAIQTGDMRAFKIRIVMFKARDSLSGSPLYNDFVLGLEECISEAEKRAGCVPDPTPRRLSKAEQERKRIREQSLSSHKSRAQQNDERSKQLHLDYWSKPEDNAILSCSGTTVQPHLAADNAAIEERTSATIDCIKPNTRLSPSSKPKDEKDKGKSNIPNGGIDSCEILVNSTKESKARKVSKKSKCNVTHNVRCNVTRNVTKKVRKLRDYNEISEILEDIKSGGVSPYESVEEIIADYKKGEITKVEAMMFTAALDIYKPEEKLSVLDGLDEDIDDENGEDYDDGYGDDDDDEDREPEDDYDRWAYWNGNDD